MSSKQSAYDTLMKTASSVVEKLNTIVRELDEYYKPESLVTVEAVRQQLKVLQNELQYALSLARHATTIEPQKSGPTKSTSISKDTLEAIEVSALVIAQATKILASNNALHLLNKDQSPSGADDGLGECTCDEHVITLCVPCRMRRLFDKPDPSHRDYGGGE